jgi:hypothetical protein
MSSMRNEAAWVLEAPAFNPRPEAEAAFELTDSFGSSSISIAKTACEFYFSHAQLELIR